MITFSSKVSASCASFYAKAGVVMAVVHSAAMSNLLIDFIIKTPVELAVLIAIFLGGGLFS